MLQTNSRIIAVISYLTWIGWIAAVVLHNRGNGYEAQHINQALIINILSVLGGIAAALPLIGHTVSAIAGAAVLVFTIMGIYRAVQWRNDPLPFIGDLNLLY